MSDLNERDTQAITAAVGILSEAGFSVTKVNKGTPSDSGVSFKLQVEGHTSRRWFQEQCDAVHRAASDAPEFGMGGTRIDEDGDPDE